MSHDTWVALHVLGVVVFLGNLVVTAVWKTLADRTRDASVIAYAQRLVTITDVSFTATGAALITLSGFALADDWGGVTGPSWLTVGVGLFAAAGLIWLTILIPIQIAQTRLSRRFAATGRSRTAIGGLPSAGTCSAPSPHCCRLRTFSSWR